MTAHPRAATSWRRVEIHPTVEADGPAAVSVRFGAGGRTHVLSPDEAEDVASRLLETAKLAKAGVGRDDPERAS